MSRISPKYLPQINTPINDVLKKLDDENIEYNYIRVNPNELNSSQPFTLSDDVETAILDDMNPIWLDDNNSIIDGHHKWIKALLDNVPLIAIKLNINFKDACRILNKIQDIYEYEQQQQMEEVVAQDVINTDNQINNGISDGEFLDSLEEDNVNIETEKPSVNPKTIIAYRKEPIKENSVVGNFFTLNPIEGYSKYEIDFNNLLDTNQLGLKYKDGQQPVEILAKIWFPHINFEKIAVLNNTEPIKLKNKAITEKAMKLGFDGIKYGDKLIQGLK